MNVGKFGRNAAGNSRRSEFWTVNWTTGTHRRRSQGSPEMRASQRLSWELKETKVLNRDEDGDETGKLEICLPGTAQVSKPMFLQMLFCQLHCQWKRNKNCRYMQQYNMWVAWMQLFFNSRDKTKCAEKWLFCLSDRRALYVTSTLPVLHRRILNPWQNSW